MKKNIFTVNILALSAVALISSSVMNSGSPHSPYKSQGGPVYNTNAPGEKTCSGPEGTSTCHSGGIPDNTGPATVSVFSSGGNQYVPGQTYTITPTITHPTRTRFGFQLVALKASNDANIGDIQITDTTTTKAVYPTYGNFQTREYAEHKLAGTYFTSTTGQWSFNWEAPSVNEGNIILYACFSAVNNNNTNDPGDETYYTTLLLTPSGMGTNGPDDFSDAINIFPNPAKEFFNLELDVQKSGKVSAGLMTLDGKIAQRIFEKNIPQGNFSEKIYIEKSASPGIYFLKISSGQKTVLKKIMVSSNTY